MSKKDFKKLSLKFRRITGDLINCTQDENYPRLFEIFMNFIENEPLIADFIHKNNIKEFDIETAVSQKEWNERLKIPTDEKEEISFIYQLFKYFRDENNSIQDFVTLYVGERKIARNIEIFNNEVVRRLYNHINQYLEELSIDMGYDEDGKIIFKGDIGQLHQLNYAEGNAQINAQYLSTTNNFNDICTELLDILSNTRDIPTELKEDAIDLIKGVQEEMKTEKPKKGILRAATEKLKEIQSLVANGTALAITAEKFIEEISKLIQ